MNKVKKFAKAHKKEIIFVAGSIALAVGCIIVTKQLTKFNAGFDGGASFVPNAETDMIDLYIFDHDRKAPLWSFSYGEAAPLAVELDDSIACLRPEG